MTDLGTKIVGNWKRFSRLPGGRWLYSRLLGRLVRYTGSIGANIVSLEPGLVVVTLRDRAAVRNHLKSVHAIAQANLAEMASGLAMITALPPNTRGIVTSIEIEYFKKARGRLTATGTASPNPVDEPIDEKARAEIIDISGEIVAKATINWRLAPVPLQ